MMRKTVARGGSLLLCGLVTAFSCLFAADVARAAQGASSAAREIRVGAGSEAKATFWLQSSLRRVYPDTPPGSTDLQLIAPRNGRVAFQACVRMEDVNGLSVECKVNGADDLRPRVRWAGLVPLKHFTPDTPIADVEGVGNVPGMVPDPLLPITKVNFGPRQSHAFWVTLHVPSDATVGRRELTVRFISRGGGKGAKEQVVELPVRLEVSPLVLQPRKDFPVIHWWRGEATWDYYKTGMFEDPKWWEITRAQLQNMLDHGSDVVYVPIFFDRRETFKRPCQLLAVDEPTPGKYTFDWTRTKKFVDMCKEIGFTKFEWSHLWIYWGAENPVRVYRKQGEQFVMLWPPDISGFSDTFVNFLKQFLPEFKAFLDREGLLEHSYFHLSDEPGPGQHLANYKRARKILHELAPWMKVMDALSDIEYGRQNLTDIPIPLVSAAQAYIDERIPHWVYYCCVPTGEWLNRFLDTPLTKVRMSGMIFYRLKADGFLHWGFNYWHRMEQEVAVDPFYDTTGGGGVPAGDPFVIYPGGDGKPIDSIRWEVFAESLQDYAILQTAGISPDDPMLADIKSYKDFPRQEEWIRRTIERVLRNASASPASAAVIQSHRGAGELAPENTLGAFELGWKLGTIPEADIRQTKDGVIVTFHDNTFERVVRGAGEALKKKGVEDLTWDELSNLDVGAWRGDEFTGRRVSTLAQAFERMKGRPQRQMYLDIKKVDLEKLAAEVKAHGVGPQVILASTKYDVIRRWKQLVPDGRTLLWMGSTAPDAEARLRARVEELKKADFADVTQLQVHIHLNGKPLDGPDAFKVSDAFLAELAGELEGRGILFQALPYDTADARVYRRLLDLGVQSFATDHPDRVVALMADHAKKNGGAR